MLLNVDVEGALVQGAASRGPPHRRRQPGPARLRLRRTSSSSTQTPAGASTGGTTGGKPDEDGLPALQLREPADARALRRPAPRDTELQAPRRAQRHLRQPLHRLDALHAGAARHADRPPLLPAPQLGPARALRQFLPRAPEDRRRLLAPDLRPLPLLGGRRRHLPHPLQLLRVHPRPGVRPLEGAARLADRADPRQVPPEPERPELAAEPLQLHDQPRIHHARRRTSPRSSASTPPSTSSTGTGAPTTGSCRSRPSTRTSPSSPPSA